MANLSNRNVFITGATAGIGEVLAREYRRLGANVLFCGRRADRVASLEKELSALGEGIARGFVVDVCRPADFEAVRAWVKEKGLRVDTVVANAGVGIGGTFEKLSNDDYRRQFETNVFGVMNAIRPFLSDLRATRGRIGIVGSANSYISLAETSAYCMSKAAIRAFADSLDLELWRDGVSVTLLTPGLIATEIRSIDNSGKIDPTYRDPYPAWVNLPAPKAAAQIRRAIEARAPERPIALHIRPLLFMQKFFPGLSRVVKRRIEGVKKGP
jgi:short-subunit dehydrogenase